MKVKVISLPYIFQVLYVLCFNVPRYQVSFYRTIGPLVENYLPVLSCCLFLFRSKRRREDPEFGKKKFGGKRSNQGKRGNLKKNVKQGFQGGKKSRGGGRGGGGGKRGGKR